MAYSKEHEKQEELREMRKKAKDRAKQKALRRMKQLERKNEGSLGDEDGRGSNLWAATIASTRIGLGVGISSRSDSGAGSPPEELQSRPITSEPLSPTSDEAKASTSANSYALSQQEYYTIAFVSLEQLKQAYGQPSKSKKRRKLEGVHIIPKKPVKHI